MKPLLIALSLVVAEPAMAQFANPQLVASVEVRMRHFGIHADVSHYPLYAVAQLHGILNSRDDYFTKRRRLRAVLRNAAPG